MWGAGWVWLAGGLYKDGRKRRGSSHLPRASPSPGDSGNGGGNWAMEGKPCTASSDPARSNTTLYIPAFLHLPPSQQPLDKKVWGSSSLMRRFSGHISTEPRPPPRRVLPAPRAAPLACLAIMLVIIWVMKHVLFLSVALINLLSI